VRLALQVSAIAGAIMKRGPQARASVHSPIELPAGGRGCLRTSGAPPLDLIDGSRLCLLLKTYGLGVKVTTRTVEDVTVIPGFFSEEFE